MAGKAIKRYLDAVETERMNELQKGLVKEYNDGNWSLSDGFMFETLPCLVRDMVRNINDQKEDLLPTILEYEDNVVAIEVLHLIAKAAMRRTWDATQKRIDARDAFKRAYMAWFDKHAEGFDEDPDGDVDDED